MCTFANRKGTLFTIQVYRKFLFYQENNARFSVEKKRFELYTIKNESGGKLKWQKIIMESAAHVGTVSWGRRIPLRTPRALIAAVMVTV